VETALAAVALDSLAQVPVRLLSTGQRRRAALARVIASGAPVWLLDEPANGLDAASVGLLEAAIATHRDEGGVVLAATHLPLAMPGAQEIAL
jgi:heme exporter protein A